MNKKKVMIILLFLLFLTGLRLLWFAFVETGESSPVLIQEGHGHIQEQNAEKSEIFQLEGEWEFYPEQIIDPEKVEDGAAFQNKKYTVFPDQWFSYIDNQAFSSGTFRMQASLDESFVDQPLAIYIPRIPSANHIYINGELIGKSGNPSMLRESFVANTLPYYIMFQVHSPDLDIVVQASDDGRVSNFGIQPLLFGFTADIQHTYQMNMLWKGIVLIFMLLLFIAAVLLFCMQYKTKLAFYFGLLMMSASLMILFDPDGAPLLSLFIDATIRSKIIFLIHISIATSLLKFIEYFLPGYFPALIYRMVTTMYLLYGLLIILLPISIIWEYQFLLGIVYFSCLSIIITQIVKANLAGEPNTLLLILAAIAVLNSIIWSTLKHEKNMIMNFYPFDLFIALLLFELFWICMFLKHVRDVEEKNTKLQLANKSRDDFLANTSHEMRNPLHSMMHIAQYVLDNPANKITNKDRDDLLLLIQVGRRMSMLINDLIDLSQLKEHHLRLDKKSVDLHVQMKMVLDMLTHVVEGKPLQIINRVDPSFPLLDADENRLNQILLNLLHNAIKFTDEGTIMVRSHVANDMAVIEVIDSGEGIEADKIEKIFLPYEQIITEYNAYHSGTGIGLAITKELIELQGGTIDVESELGKGTTFRFTLDLYQGKRENLENLEIPTTEIIMPEGLEDASPAASNQKHFKLLLVDDEKINLTVVSKILDQHRYEITFANNGEEAWHYINNQRFDLVISDVMMPGISGFELTRKIRIKHNLSELPILLLTARARAEDLEAGFKAGANDYVVKPIEPLELRARVQVLTDLKEAISDRLSMEAAWLRAQVNPHFIFNTLTSILSLMVVDKEKMTELLDHFNYFMQSSFAFQNMDELVSLKQELKLVDAYLGIEQARFGDKIKVNKQIDVKTEGILIPPLTVQTLVENAIKHGILKRQQGGEVTIQAVYSKGKCEMRIKDNGVGFQEEVKEKWRSEKRKHGVGLLNTEKRLFQYMGEGLMIDSSPDKGTIISFRLPVVDDVK
ncbi:ATP-binding protein [Gracilibacillus timonensis]|uniref:ATP-binding protein n=1 Tax=Gracilibacillus timonensis TaxID=1816696 RepID=UPI00082550A2|nr:ATP-binding protein [Gracilibacillus timonensis]